MLCGLKMQLWKNEKEKSGKYSFEKDSLEINRFWIKFAYIIKDTTA